MQIGTCQAGLTNTEFEFQYLEALGVSVVRNSIPWHRVEPEPGEWDFSYYDRFMSLAQEHDIKVLILLAYDTPWLYDEGEKTRNITPDKLPHFLEYVKQVALRYGDQAAGFEIWNEPNFNRFWRGSNEDFFELTRQTIQTLNTRASGVPVGVGSILFHPLWGGEQFLKAMREYGVLESADALALHPYSFSTNRAAHRVAKARSRLEEKGYDLDIWITEVGFPTGGWYLTRTGLEGQALKVIETLTKLSAAGADVICWFKLFDDQPEGAIKTSASSEKFFGLMYPDFTTKPAAATYRLLAKELEGARYLDDIKGVHVSSHRSVETYSYRQENGNILIIAYGNRSPKSVQIEGFTGIITTIDLLTGLYNKIEDSDVSPNEIVIEAPLLIKLSADADS